MPRANAGPGRRARLLEEARAWRKVAALCDTLLWPSFWELCPQGSRSFDVVKAMRRRYWPHLWVGDSRIKLIYTKERVNFYAMACLFLSLECRAEARASRQTPKRT